MGRRVTAQRSHGVPVKVHMAMKSLRLELEGIDKEVIEVLTMKYIVNTTGMSKK